MPNLDEMRKVIIEIPEEVLESKQFCQYFGVWSTKLAETIENGKPYEEPTGDLISREDLQAEYAVNCSGDCRCCDSRHCKLIDNAQAVEARPQGEWILIGEADYWYRYKCSKCEREVGVYRPDILLSLYPFCHCGAAMKAGGDSNG